MSSSLHWRPVPPPVPDSQLSSDLKFKLRERLWDGDPEYNKGHEIRNSDNGIMGYLNGLADCGVEDAQILIDLIVKHGTVEVWIGDADGPR